MKEEWKQANYMWLIIVIMSVTIVKKTCSHNTWAAATHKNYTNLSHLNCNIVVKKKYLKNINLQHPDINRLSEFK